MRLIVGFMVFPTSSKILAADREFLIKFPHIPPSPHLDSLPLFCPPMFESMMRELVEGPAKTQWVRQGLPPDDLENLWLTEMPDPSVDSSFKLGTAAQVCTSTRSGIQTYHIKIHWHHTRLRLQD